MLIFIIGCSQSGKEIQSPENEVTETEVTGEVKEFTMTAKQWEFIPNTITANKGDKVKITIKSVDVSHGFNLPDFGINERLDPGKEVHIEFVADKKGTFDFQCDIPCGRGHSGMRGKLIIE